MRRCKRKSSPQPPHTSKKLKTLREADGIIAQTGAISRGRSQQRSTVLQGLSNDYRDCVPTQSIISPRTTRSGKIFAACTSVNIGPLLQGSMESEDRRFYQRDGGIDSDMDEDGEGNDHIDSDDPNTGITNNSITTPEPRRRSERLKRSQSMFARSRSPLTRNRGRKLNRVEAGATLGDAAGNDGSVGGSRSVAATDRLQRSESLSVKKYAPALHNKSSSHKRRDRLRQARAEAGHAPSIDKIQNIILPAIPQAIPTTLHTEALPVSRGAYRASNKKISDADKVYSLGELRAPEMGFRYIEWDGCKPLPFLDVEGRIITAGAGQPDDPSYAAAVADAFEALTAVRNEEEFSLQELDHRRGRFPQITVGVSYGAGQRVPGALKNSARRAAIGEQLIARPSISRMAAYASSAFRLWAPKLFDYYADHLHKLRVALPDLPKNYPRSIFPCTTFNLGPGTCAIKHLDMLNCPFGWCSIQALGNYNPRTSGHLVLWDLKVIVEFPPGATFLIPSATVIHSNVPLQPGESRASITQYCAGGIFRWVDNGFRTDAALAKADPQLYAQQQAAKGERWAKGMDLFLMVD